MKAYKTMRNTIAAVGLALSGNAMADEPTPTDLANKVLAYSRVCDEVIKGEFQSGESEGTTYMVNGLPQLDALMPGGVPIGDRGNGIRVDRINYRDINPAGPSLRDELEYTIMIIYTNQIREKIQFRNVFEEETYTSWIGSTYHPGFWQNSDMEIIPGESNRPFQDANRAIVLALLSMETDPALIREVRDIVESPQ